VRATGLHAKGGTPCLEAPAVPNNKACIWLITTSLRACYQHPSIIVGDGPYSLGMLHWWSSWYLLMKRVSGNNLTHLVYNCRRPSVYPAGDDQCTCMWRILDLTEGRTTQDILSRPDTWLCCCSRHWCSHLSMCHHQWAAVTGNLAVPSHDDIINIIAVVQTQWYKHLHALVGCWTHIQSSYNPNAKCLLTVGCKHVTTNNCHAETLH
jgi:hypothetical protein